MLLALTVFVALAVTGCAVYSSMASQLPDPDLTKARGRDQSTLIMDRNGKLITRLFAEQNRQDVALEKMPEYLRQAVVSTEDQRFYEHEGVDPLGIARALYTDVIRRQTAQGGSTITQQYVKNAFVTDERTLKRKVQEAILAQRVEDRFSKDEILELYLNTIYFGHGAYGVEAASRAYFGKGVEKLTLPEAAMIAGVIKSPGRYSPYLDPDAAQRRRDTVLGQMLEQGYIDQTQHDEAVASPVKPSGRKAGSALAPYFVEWVKEQLVEKYGEAAVYRGGLRVRTTLDLGAQKAAETAVASALNRKGDPSAALVSVRPATGEVVAMVGGKDFASQQFNVAVQGRRQPGSAFKPFVLATALSEGVNPEKAFESGPRSFAVGDQTWKVTGASGGGKGLMRLRPATEQSVNSVYAQLILDLGADSVVKTAKELGITEKLEAVPAIALGGLEKGVSPLEMASAYSTLAAGGRHAEPFGIAEVRKPDGTVLFKARPKPRSAIDAKVAFLTTDILTGVIKRGTGESAALGRPAAGKTGTTQEYRDAWFVGYTPDLATAVWVGYPDAQRAMKAVHGRAVTGGSFPARIWSSFMKAALASTKPTPFKRPEGLTTVRVCAVSGGKPTSFCPDTISALVIRGTEIEPCEVHKEPAKVKVPSVIGLAKGDAVAALEKLKLVVKVTERGVPGVATGDVASQSPKAGTAVEAGATVTIVVSTGDSAAAPPKAVFTARGSAKAGDPVAFDASASTGDGGIKTYYWEFGDGTTGEGATVEHVFATPGTYEVTLWVTDSRGQQSSQTQRVKVR